MSTAASDESTSTPDASPAPVGFAVPVMSRLAHDRAAERRADDAWLDEAWASPSTRVLLLSSDGMTPSASGTTLDFAAPADTAPGARRILLGQAGGTVYFAVFTGEPAPSQEWRQLRELATLLDPLEVGLLTPSVALLNWHSSHTHCPRCGTATEWISAGWATHCPADDTQHFPRTDPAVIMLVHDGAGRCVLGRSAAWPAGRFSILAGFVEAGESLEAAVAREVAEEVGLDVTDIRYRASQPHPFPASLMLGFTALAEGGGTIRIDDEEIVAAGWFTKDEVRRAAEFESDDDWLKPAGGDDDTGPVLRALPPPMSIARQLVDAWLDDQI